MQNKITKTSRYGKGMVTYIHRGKPVTSTVGSRAFDLYSLVLSQGNFELGRIPPGYEYRPDSIANLFFGTTDYWWKLMMINNIWDPFEGLSVGNQVLLPRA
jgi:hypothetical protein